MREESVKSVDQIEGGGRLCTYQVHVKRSRQELVESRLPLVWGRPKRDALMARAGTCQLWSVSRLS
jgi:hypothetical protein